MAESSLHRHPHLEPGDDAYEFRPPPKCCLDHFNKFAEKQRLYADSLQEEAVHAERRRVVLTAVEAITTYGHPRCGMHEEPR